MVAEETEEKDILIAQGKGGAGDERGCTEGVRGEVGRVGMTVCACACVFVRVCRLLCSHTCALCGCARTRARNEELETQLLTGQGGAEGRNHQVP